MSSHWFPLNWGADCPAGAPQAVVSLAALGDMSVKPKPSARVRAEIAKVFPEKRFVWLIQEHTHIVLWADQGGGAAGQTGDGLLTNDPEALIGVTVADCLPIFLWDTASGARALVHSGWKGTGIVREALRLMKIRYGSPPEAIRAIIGPGIHACCYAVPRERAEVFAAKFGSDTAFSRDGAWYMDLCAANRHILAGEGVHALHIHPECTCCDTRFSSYRRQGNAYTRMIALLGVLPTLSEI